MTSKLALLLFIASLSLRASAQGPEDFATHTIADPSQASSFLSRVSTYEAQLRKDPRFSSLASVVQTAIPKTVTWDGMMGPGETVLSETWFRALPTDVKSWIFSVASEERKLVTATGDGAAASSTMAGGGQASATATAAATTASSVLKSSGQAGAAANTTSSTTKENKAATSSSSAAATSAKANGADSRRPEILGALHVASGGAVVAAGALLLFL